MRRPRFLSRRNKQRLKWFLSAVVLIALGGAVALALHPLLPIEFKQSVEEWWDDALTPSVSPLREPSTASTPPKPQPTLRSFRQARSTPMPATALIPIIPPSFTADVTTLSDQRAYLLDLVNRDRASVGSSPVTLGTNTAAQEHAEEMLEHSYLSHWGLNGLAPYMRFTLAGGVNYEGENIFGIAAPLESSARYPTISIKQELRETQRSWMDSPGHRNNILNPWHKKVNLGIACNRITCAAVQQFQGDYIEFGELPAIREGVLTIDANLLSGFQLSSIDVWYDPPPHQLTLGQLDRTHSYNTGEAPVAFLRPPPPPSWSYPEVNNAYNWESSLSPYDVPSDSSRLLQGSVSPKTLTTKTQPIIWVTADTWEVNGGAFNVKADLGPIVAASGPGVYTVLVWSEADGEDVLLAKYSIFLLDE